MPEQHRITRRADGRFVGTYQLNGTRRFVYGKTEPEVRRKLTEVQRQTVIVGAVPTPGRRSVNDLLDVWLDASRGTLKPKTLVGYEDTTRWYIRPTLGSVKLTRLEPSRVQALYAHLTSVGHARIPAQAHAVLHRARRLRAGTTWCDDELVFSTIRGKPLYKGCVAKALRVACERLGLLPLTPHGLRHLSASLLLSENVPLPNVSQRLGHADTSITARIYSHVVRPDRRIAELLNQLVEGTGVAAATEG